MAVAGDGNQFPDSSAALVIALAMQHKVHGFSGLRTDESLIQICPCTQGHIRKSVERIQGGISMQCGERSTVPGVHGLKQVVAAFVADFAHDDSVGTVAEGCRYQLAWSDGNLDRKSTRLNSSHSSI